MGCLPIFKVKPDDGAPRSSFNSYQTQGSQRESIVEEKSRVSNLNNLIIHSAFMVQESLSDPFDIYDFLKVIGEGSFGKVSKVVHRKLNIVRALKAIEKRNEQGLITEENTRNLLKEINVLKHLDHPNIIKIYEFFNTNSKIYITSEYCSGGELFDQLDKIRNFKERSIAHIMKQLLSAVSFMHANGFIHRDLKPENIMIESIDNNNKEHFDIKLIDFGTSSIYKDKKNTKRKIFSEKIGSSYYMAPEILNGDYDEKCDCWSVGVIMYMLLSGRAPFDGNDDQEIFNNIINSEVKFPENIFDKYSKDAKELLKNLLIKNVKERISSYDALTHKWFNIIKNEYELNNSDRDTLIQISENLHNFKKDMKFQQACVSFIVHNMVKKEEVKKYRDLFQKFDKNSDGQLTKEELIKGFSVVMSEEEATRDVTNLVDHIDKDKNDTIEFEEFLSAFMDKKILLKEDNLMETFMYFDKDGSGKITVQELKDIMTGNMDVKESVWEEMLMSIDQNSDGEISYSEYKKIMRKLFNK